MERDLKIVKEKIWEGDKEATHTLLLFIVSCPSDLKDVESTTVCHHQRILTPLFPRVMSSHTYETHTRAQYRQDKCYTAKT